MQFPEPAPSFAIGHATPLKICATNFWGGFSLERGFVKYLLHLAVPYWRPCATPAEADLVIASVFPHEAAEFPHKTLAVIWENIRPNYDFYAWSISSDPDHYAMRNFRLPLWHLEIGWSAKYQRWNLSGNGCHGHEPLLRLPALLEPRSAPFRQRPRFCGFVASNPERYRMMAAEALGRISPVDLYGPIGGPIESRSKYDILRDHMFSLCFENSLFPGYHTEKLLQAWAAGTIPLYFGDKTVDLDFNPAAFLNCHDFPSLDSFVDAVERLFNTPAERERIWREPLLKHPPSLDPAVAFLRKTIGRILT